MKDRKPKRLRRNRAAKEKAARAKHTGPTIEIYPECQKADWVKVGAVCHCWGEGDDLFRIEAVHKNMVSLVTMTGHAHGLESMTKIYQMGFVEDGHDPH